MTLSHCWALIERAQHQNYYAYKTINVCPFDSGIRRYALLGMLYCIIVMRQPLLGGGGGEGGMTPLSLGTPPNAELPDFDPSFLELYCPYHIDFI